MAKQADDQTLIDIGAQHQLFIMEDRKLNPDFKFGGIWYRGQVQAGNIWSVYCDGKQYEYWEAGPHVLWNGLWHQWRALIINVRIVHLHFAFEGRIRGPQLAQETSSAAGVDLGCTVRAKLELPCRVDINYIERFLKYENPLSVFGASLKNMVIEMIQALPYDHFGSWATMLRNQVQQNLQMGENDTLNLLGMKVEKVYVTSVEPDSVVDRNRMAMYQLVERAKREMKEAEANKERNTVVAQDFAGQGGTLNIAPSILALQNSPIGKELIAHDASLREMMMAAGLNPSVSLHPIRDPQGQLGTPIASAGYLNPPQSGNTDQSYGNTGPISSSTVSGSLQWTGGQSMPFSPPSMPMPTPAPMEGPSLDSDRQDQELMALQAAGFQCAGRGQFSPTYDSSGQPIQGSMEWSLEVYIERINRVVTIVFHCPSGYPSVPPRVQIRSTNSERLRTITPNIIKYWNDRHMLVEIAREIDDTTL